MEERNVNNSNYQKGFNEGYIITKYEPALSDMINLLKIDSIRGEGFRDGRQECFLEQTKEHHPSWLTNQNRFTKTEIDKDKDRHER